MKAFLSTAQAAARLGVDPSTLARWRTAKKGPPAYKVGKAWKYDEMELTAYLESCRLVTTKESSP